MQHVAIIRLIGDRLAWYAPGGSEEPRWLDDDSAAADLRALLAQRRSAVCFAAPGADVRLLSIPVTPAEKKHIDKSLPYALEEQVAEDIEELHFAHCALDKNVLGVAICAREKMAEWGERLADFPGINRWVPEPLVLPWQPGEWCVVLEGDTAIVRCGSCSGFSIERDMAPALLESVLEEGDPPQAVIVYGAEQQADLGLLPGTLRDVAQWRAGNLYAALLLADAGDANLNLLQGAYAARLPLGRWWRYWRPVAATFAIALLVQLAALYADYRNLQAQNENLRAAVQESYRKAFPRGQVVDAEKQLRRQLDALRGTSQSTGFVSLIERVGAAVAGEPDTSIATINYNDRSGEMRMNISAADFEGVEDLRRRINEAGLEAVMESSSAQDDRVRARLRVAKRS
ncbi:MAG: type II secretion system protein GspL [Halioglobus sp.]|nr:type II secretion system protein GspL [Halioglobus sp.]